MQSIASSPFVQVYEHRHLPLYTSTFAAHAHPISPSSRARIEGLPPPHLRSPPATTSQLIRLFTTPYSMNYYKYMYIIRIELVVALFDGCVVLALCTTRSTHTSQRWQMLQHVCTCNASDRVHCPTVSSIGAAAASQTLYSSLLLLLLRSFLLLLLLLLLLLPSTRATLLLLEGVVEVW